MKAFFQPVVKLTQASIDAGDGDSLSGVRIAIVDSNSQPTGKIYESGPSGSVPTEAVTSDNINTVMAAAGGAGWEKVQATTASYAIAKPISGAGLDLHIEVGGSLAPLNSTSWSVPASGVDQLRIRNFSGSAKTLTAGTGWIIVTADGNSVTGGSYSIPNDRAVEVTLDPDGFAQVVPWGGEVSQATLDAHTGNTSNPHGVTKSQIGLGSADNVSDTNKPVSTAQQTALNLKANSTALTDGSIHAVFESIRADGVTFLAAATDPKDIVGTGWFNIQNPVGLPVGWYYIFNAVHRNSSVVDTTYSFQLAKRLDSASINNMLMRTETFSTYSAWRTLATSDGTISLGTGQTLDAQVAAIADIVNMFANVSSTATSTIANTDVVARLARAGFPSTKYGNTMDVVIGSHTAGIAGSTQVDFRLNNGNTASPDMTVMTLRGDGQVLVSANPTAALGVATKQYADGLVVGLLDYRGAFTPAVSSGATGYPTTGGSGTSGVILKGDVFVASAAGFILTEAIQIGDTVLAKQDTPGQTATNWDKLNANVSYVPEDQASKVVAFSTPTDTQYPSAKLVSDQLALKSATSHTHAPDATKQDLLSSGNNIRTINSQSILGSGNIAIASSTDAPTRLWDSVTDFSTGDELQMRTSGLPASGAIATWSDESGNARNFTQATTSIQPNANIQLNGLPVATFATDDYLVNTTNLTLKPVTFVALFRLTALGTLQTLFSGASSSLQFLVNSANRLALTQTWVGAIGTANTTLTTGTWYLGAITYNASGLASFRLNGTADGSATSNVTIAASLYDIGRNKQGGAEYWNGNIAELLVYNSVLSDANIELIEGYIMHKFGLQVSLATGHPYRTTAPSVLELPTYADNAAAKVGGLLVGRVYVTSTGQMMVVY